MIWKSEKRKLSELNPAPYNPRQLTEKQAKDLGRSLTKFNLADPIVINQNNTIIGGHQRIKILQSQGVSDVDVRVPDRLLSEEEEKELNLRLNKNLGEWDYDLLANFDEGLLKDIGFDSKELDRIFQIDAKPEDDEVPQVKATTDIKLGDMFQLGRHRLLCGDSTKREDVERLMGGAKADMVFTDPPYGVNFMSRKDKRHPLDYTSKPYEDDFTKEEFVDFSSEIFKQIEFNLKDGGVFYVWGADRSIVAYYHFESDALLFHKIIVWDKDWSFLNRKDLLAQNEFCIYGWKRGKERKFNRLNYSDIWKVKKENPNKMVHSAQKPIALIEMGLNMSSDREELCLDLFLGSGSTLIACEKTSRICYGMEIDPIYCQVIIDRWEKYTNGKAEKIH